MPTLSGFTVVLGDRVKETTQTTGTGTYSLDGASTGFRTFVAGIGSGNRTVCTVASGASYEIFIGTVTAGAPATISRDVILVSSNSNNAVNWSPGVKDIFCDVPAALVNQISPDSVTSVKVTQFTSNATWTRDANCLFARVRIVGGGGAGGGAPVTGLGEEAEGGGGGGGEYAEGVFTAAQLGSSRTVTIGAGATGTTGSGAAGGTTSFGPLITALGGSGGTVGEDTAGHNNASGGAGGQGGAGGYLRLEGERGGWGAVRSGTRNLTGWGGPAGGGFSAGARAVTGQGPGRAYGGGGSGGSHGQNSGPTAGGSGAAGICIVEEFLRL